jgi:quinolinate synthase
MPDLKDKILKLKEKKNALILVHNYQTLDVQDVGDFIGDSLELARKATEAGKGIIVFCGVRFMAETAKILNPGARVLIPRPDVSCPMADMITADDLTALKQRYPDAVVCSYVNTNADVKAESDICCTSANAVDVVESIGGKQVLFTPDRNLASFVDRSVNVEIIPYDGFCYVHHRFAAEDIIEAKMAHPDAVVLVHPECNPEVVDLADEVLSTSGMLRYARESSGREFIVATEEGLLERMAREMPGKVFLSPGKARFCFNMKKIRLEDVYTSLRDEVYEVTVDEKIMKRARASLERMIALGK